MTEKTVKVVALVVDSGSLIFYKTDGSTFTFQQGSAEGAALSDEFAYQKGLGKEVVELTLSSDLDQTSHLAKPRAGGLIRFFLAPVEAVKRMFNGAMTNNDHVAPHLSSPEEAAAAVRRLAERVHAIADNEKSAAVGADEGLPLRIVTEDTVMAKHETLVAVTNEGIVPNIENLSDQFKAANEGAAPSDGVDNLIIRLGKMSATRGHTATELLNFIKKIDLPILADGSFLAYKRLLSRGDGRYVDPHTGKVFQRLGDRVQMDEKLVDPSRRTQCSQGIHVGSRRYMGCFHSGGSDSSTFFVLIQPEDVIAVPHNEADKMRVCGYTLIAPLSGKAHDLVNGNKAVSDDAETMDTLSRIVAGARPAALGVVNIGGESGSNLTYTINGHPVPVDAGFQTAKQIANTDDVVVTTASPVRTIDIDKQGSTDEVLKNLKEEKAKLDPAQKVTPEKLNEKAVKVSSREEMARAIINRMQDQSKPDKYRRQAALDLKEFKAKKKVSWAALGVVEAEVREMNEIIELTAPSKPAAKPAKEPAKAKPKVDAPKNTKPKRTYVPVSVKEQKVEGTNQTKTTVGFTAVTGKETRQDTARRLWGIVSDNSNTENGRKVAASELRALKKRTKVSWVQLGLGQYDVEGMLKKHNV